MEVDLHYISLALSSPILHVNSVIPNQTVLDKQAVVTQKCETFQAWVDISVAIRCTPGIGRNNIVKI